MPLSVFLVCRTYATFATSNLTFIYFENLEGHCAPCSRKLEHNCHCELDLEVVL